MSFVWDVRLQLSCMVVIIYIMSNYFTIKRVRNYAHIVFSFALVDSLVYLVFDMVTVYTVNHLDDFSTVTNRVFHNIYLTSMTFFLLLVFGYAYCVVQEPSKHTLMMLHLWSIPWLIMAILIWVLPLDYLVGEFTNYSMGPAAYMAYVCTVFYFLMACIFLIINHSRVKSEIKRLLFIAYGTQFLVLIFQALYPELLITSMAIMVNCIAIYMTLESPDIHMIERLRMEKQSAIKANRAKSDFLAKMSHELRTPINAIMGLNELIRRESKEEQIIEYAQETKESANMLLELINEILDSSKIEAGKMKVVPATYSMSKLLRDIRTTIIDPVKEKNLNFSIQLDPAIPDILWGDDLRIRQILLNLLNNAVKYTLKGDINLSIEKVRGTDHDIYVRFCVSDTGIGIKEEDIPKLFSLFERIENEHTRYEPGSGLGISIVIQLLKLMDSELQVDSIYGSGSSFSFVIKQVIPNQQTELPGPMKEDSHKSYRAPMAKLLIVDDNALNVKVFCGLLKATGIIIDKASSAKEALEYLKENQYHVMFIDHMMPEMNGIELYHEIKRLGLAQNTPAIMLSANAVVGAREMYLSEGFTDYLSKPIIPEKLDEIIFKYLPKEIIEEIN